MQLTGAYIAVVLIWATTPLAIQWSSESVGYLFGISSRFLLAAIIAISICMLLNKKLSFESKAIQAYFIGGVGISLAMLCVYWAAQFIPSGWISIIFGMTPIVTGLFAMKILGERGLNAFRLLAIIMAITGLYIMLETATQFGPNTTYGIFGVCLSVVLHSLCMVMLKKVNAKLDTYSSVTGTLLVAATLFFFVWTLFGAELPTEVPKRAGFSIFYLAIIGSVLGFFLFYYVLKHVEATRAALITLLTPVGALFLGHLINHEPLNSEIVTGCIFILSGLLFFEFEGAIRRLKIINVKEKS